MGVYIKGMDMPKHCGECGIDWCNIWRRAETPKEKRPPDCPLIEIPTPHGRLIDADELLSSLAHNLGIRSLEYLTSQERAIVSWIDAAPTIIPADDKDINVHNKEEGE